MKEFKFCGEMTEYVEIPVTVCETQKEMVAELVMQKESFDFSAIRMNEVEEKRINGYYNLTDGTLHEYAYREAMKEAISGTDEEMMYIIYKDGSEYWNGADEVHGKFKRYGIKRAIISTPWGYTVFGDFAINDMGDVTIEEREIEEYGVYAGQYDVKEEPEATAETVEETIVTVNQTEVITMKRTFKNFDEYSEYYENREHKMNDVDVVENTVTVCADGEFECKNWKTAVRRFFKEINDNSLFDGWKECITECVENGIWKEKEEYNGKHVCGGWFWEVECIDEGYWYVSLTVSKEIEEESESAETVESVEETTVSETETVETEVAEKFIIYVSDDDLNVFCAKVFVGTVKELDDECDRIIAETNCEEYLHVLCYTDKRWEWVQKHYNQVSKSALSVVVRKTETAEQETELNAEVAEVEAEQTAEPETFSKSKSESESEPTAENITVSGTNQGNINVLIVADIANTFEMITHTGYFDTS